MNGYIFSMAITYIIAIVALAFAAKANSKINDHYEHDHINSEMEQMNNESSIGRYDSTSVDKPE